MEKIIFKNEGYTSRELDIISLIFCGVRSTKNISYILELSHRTVDCFINHITKKMRVNCRKDIGKIVINKKDNLYLKTRYEKLFYDKFKKMPIDFFDDLDICFALNHKKETLFKDERHSY